MAKPRKTNARVKPAEVSPRERALAYVFVSASVVYLLAFFLTSLGIPQLPGMNRSMIWQFLLIPDDLIAGWLGDQGQFAFLDRLPILFGACLLHACAFVVGWTALQCATKWRGCVTMLERALVAHGVGLSVISLGTFGVGVFGGLHERWLLLGPMLAVPAAAILLRVRNRPANATSPLPARQARPADASDWLSRGWLVLALPFAVFVTLGGMLPPIEFDVREYHLQAPKEFFQLGRIEFLPHNVYANMPLGAEMWPLAAMSVAGDWWIGALIGKTVIATLLPFTALALYAAGRRIGSRTAGIMAAIVYLSFPWMLQVSMLGLIEGAVAFFVALALLILLPQAQQIAGEGPPPATAIVAGFFAGSAAACKYPALLFVVAPIVAWIGWNSRRNGRWNIARQASIGLLAASFACGPWLVKNAYFTGNPAYPLFYSVFDGATRTPELAAQWNQAHRPQGFGPQNILADAGRVLLTSPWLSAIVWPLVGWAIAGAWMHRRDGDESPCSRTLVRTVLPQLIAFAGFMFLCWWCLTHRIDRFWLPATPALAMLAGCGAAHASDKFGRYGVLGLLGVGLSWNLLATASPVMSYNRFFTPLDELRIAPERVDPWILELNRQDGGVLSIGEAAVFDLEKPVLYNTTFDPSWFTRYGVGGATSSAADSVAGFDKLVADQELDYVYVDWDEIDRYRSPGNYGFDERVTPALFQQLVAEGRLLTPLPKKPGHAGEVYQVQ